MGYAYRKKPVEVEAFQWKSNVLSGKCGEIPRWIIEGLKDGRLRWYSDLLVIVTLEGNVAVLPGFWVIRESYGLFRSCHPKMFEQLYEPIDVRPAE